MRASRFTGEQMVAILREADQTSGDGAKSFLSSKGGDVEFRPLKSTDDAMDGLAKAMGCCPVEPITFDPYLA